MARRHIHKTVQRADVLNHVQHDQSVRSDEGRHVEGDADLEQFDTAAGRDTASHAAVAVVVEAGNIRHSLAREEDTWHRVGSLDAGPLKDSGPAIFGQGRKDDLIIVANAAEISETVQ